MMRWRELGTRLRGSVRRGSGEREMEDEMRFHLDMATERNLRLGLSPEEARRRAHLVFGDGERFKEEGRDALRVRAVENVLRDVQYGLRSLRRLPAFTTVAVLTLALAIGANSAVFTVVHGVLLRPLPFHDPGRLFVASFIPTNLPFDLPPGLYDRLYLEYRQATRVFERVTAYQREQYTLSGVGDAARLTGARADADFFSVLGVSPVAGRVFTRDEEEAGRDRVVILSDQLWRDRFGAAMDVIGRTITLGGLPHTVIGIMPPGFGFPAPAQLWTPLAVQLESGNSFIFPVIGRLRDGATIEQARAELESIALGMPRDERGADFESEAAIIPLKDELTGSVEKSLLIFAGAVAFVLLIACVNVANLLLIRAATRRQEMAVRTALGASRPRLISQLLTESVLIAGLGGIVGVLVALAGFRVLLMIAPAGSIPRLDEVHVDGWVLAFTLGVSLITGVAFGVLPASSSSKRQPQEALASGVRSLGGVHNRLRAALVIAEIALALVLLTGSGLMVKSFIRMRSLDKGFDAARVVTLTVDLPRTSYPDAPRVRAFHNSFLERLSNIPGVRATGAVSFRPMASIGIMGDFRVDGPTPLGRGFSVDKPTVSSGYFDAMGIRLLRGRDFTARDDSTAPGVVIVSESVARRVWPNDEAVGKRISMAEEPSADDWLTVVGVADDVVQGSAIGGDALADELTRHSTIYLPYRQMQSLWFIDHMTFIVRAERRPDAIVPAMRAALREVDPAVPAQALQTMDESMLQVFAEPLFQARLLTIFSLLAVILAAIGTYGVLAYDVAQRTREIGLRLALGASPRDIMRMVMRRTAALALSGAAIGLLGSLAITHVLTASLFEVRPGDPATLAVVAATIVMTALLAGYVPARRATGVEALTALRHE